MKTYTDQGFTFKQTNINEADIILSVFTKHNGRVDAVAKGSRKILSKKRGNFDLLSLSKFSFYKGRNLDIVTEVELITSYSQIKPKLFDTYIALFLCEILDIYLKIGEINKKLFLLLTNLLDGLNIDNSSFLISSFIFKLLQIEGFNPSINECLVCGKELKEKENKYLASFELGFLCKNEKINSNNLRISDKILKILRFFRDYDLNEAKRLKPDKNLSKELLRLVTSWVEISSEKEIKSKGFLLSL